MLKLAHLTAVLLLWAPASSLSTASSAKSPDPQVAAKLFARGNQALSRNQTKEAVRLFSRCLAMDPEHCECLRHLGNLTQRAELGRTDAAIGFMQRYVDVCPQAQDVEKFFNFMSQQPPRTPRGLPRCTAPLEPARPLPQRVGETLRYHVNVNGLSVGVIDFKIEQRGTFNAVPVTEYRAAFNIDSLVGSFIPLEGRAASLVPVGTYIPSRAMNRLQVRDQRIEEDLAFGGDGRHLTSDWERNGKARRHHRRYLVPSTDLLTAFYGMRSLEREATGCASFFGNRRAHTVWVEFMGAEKINTPVGIKMADRYKIRYATEVSRKIHEGTMWLSQDKSRLPYAAQVHGKDRMDVKIHMYEAGKPDGVY